MSDLEPTTSSADVLADGLDPGPSDEDVKSANSSFGESDDMGGDSMDVQADDSGDDLGLGDSDQVLGKRVKVYELRDQAWFDRGTGRCRGLYDDTVDAAYIVVDAERGEDEMDGQGGFLQPGQSGFVPRLLHTQVAKDENYSKQQETLIVWTDRETQLDIALSFQDPDGCEDIWQFIMEVQKHLNRRIGEESKLALGSSSPLATSPVLRASVSMMGDVASDHWRTPTLATIKEHEVWLRMQSKSAAGRERAVEHIIGEEYIKQLIGILQQAEDLESINDLHALCSLMQTILMFNDNGIFEYVLQDDIFIGVLGMLEYDPEFPTLKASYRSFFRQFSKFRQVVEIRDEGVRNKIHQTARLMFLKDVVLARMLDDPTFGILNSFVFFNQVDITNYIQTDEALLRQLFFDFHQDTPDDEASTARKRDLVLFIHQLMLISKTIQAASRVSLYRVLLDRGLLHMCEWAFRQPEATILHASAEIFTLMVEHDSNMVRTLHMMREEDGIRRPTLFTDIISLIQATPDQGLVQQLVEAMKSLLEPPPETELMVRTKDVVEGFTSMFYETYANELFRPLFEVPDLRDESVKLSSEQAFLLSILVDILSYCLMVHPQRAQFYIMANPLVPQICSLMYAREKTLRHTALRFIKACLRTGNHFLHRNFTKNRVTQAILDLVERETDRDTMLSSACLDTLEMIRKENMKSIIVDIFEKYEPTMVRLAKRPYVRSLVLALRARWDQYREPPPPPPQTIDTQSRSIADEEEAWFHEDEQEPTSTIPVKRKRSGKRSPARALGLDYDDASDSEDSVEGDAPRNEQLAEELTDVELKIRAKRQRAEEEEEGALAGLVGKPAKRAESEGGESEGKESSEGAAAATTPDGAPAAAAAATESPTAAAATGGTRKDGPAGDAPAPKDKKIRLSLGGLVKKLK